MRPCTDFYWAKNERDRAVLCLRRGPLEMQPIVKMLVIRILGSVPKLVSFLLATGGRIAMAVPRMAPASGWIGRFGWRRR